MKLGHVDHITLNVTDIKAATEAFKKLGMVVEGSLDDGDIVMLTDGAKDRPLQIQLDTVHEGMVPGLNHIAFFTETVEDDATQIKEMGFESRHDAFYQSRSGRTIFSFRGPDGVGLQLARKDKRGEYEDCPV
ncbi:MAG: VOC family protein [Chloroflexi bacterium]|nr:VOC family protein [Chloroflexota bacterium]